MKIERKKEFKEVRFEHNKFLFWTIIVLFVLLLCLIVLILRINNFNHQANDPNSSGIANPASVYCKENNGTLEIKTNDDGSQYGICSKNGKECEEWAYFREECKL